MSKHVDTGHVMAGHIERAQLASLKLRREILEMLQSPNIDSPIAWVQSSGRLLEIIDSRLDHALRDASSVNKGKSRTG